MAADALLPRLAESIFLRLNLLGAMQLASMPVTPLGRRMAYFGWDEHAQSQTQAVTTGQMAQLKSWPDRDFAAQGYCLPAVPAVPPVPDQSFELQATSTQVSRPVPAPTIVPATAVASYESRDSTGRVWGVPNAGGRGQCLDCPNKAALPSNRCKDCQLRRGRGTPMQDLSALRPALDAAARRRPDRQALVDARLRVLYEKLQNGQIADEIQQKLFRFADALGAGHEKDAQAVLQELVAEYWQQHKYWISGLKWTHARHLSSSFLSLQKSPCRQPAYPDYMTENQDSEFCLPVLEQVTVCAVSSASL
ncbi:unnamed protein product [Symbiodinium necroappetens]|uniref:Uncharacterized protein n=1 Tax=Symbiodinium necroappetens TaxID=1628268 RepID=A0A813B4K5_9DINO|nr:unnamed protein product [Symbiodinium necroappetens]